MAHLLTLLFGRRRDGLGSEGSGHRQRLLFIYESGRRFANQTLDRIDKLDL